MTKILKIPGWICDMYIHCLINKDKYKRQDVGLQDKDMTNFVYHSRRSNLRYVYLRSPLTLLLNWFIMQYLGRKMKHSFRGGINEHAAPIFIYEGESSECKAHRDRDMINSDNGIPKYVAVLSLVDDCEGGEIFVNEGPEVHYMGPMPDELFMPEGFIISRDGKYCIENHYRRRYYKLKKGDLIVFNNQTSVHGVTALASGLRITTGFRSKP